jgi:hypothetical protein
VEADLTHGLPDPEDRDELQNTIKWLSEAANDLQEILEALACDDVKLPPHHRND